MFLQEKDTEYLKKEFASLTTDVYMTLFVSELDCQYCKDEETLLNEVLETSDKLHLEVKNINVDKEDAEKYNVTVAPTLILREENKDFGISFMGIPAGHEFAALLADIKMVGTGEHGLTQETLDTLATVDEPAELLVFITPTCPHCPGATHMGHKLAYVKDNWSSAMVEAMEFPEMSQKYEVQAVPRVVTNSDAYFEGNMPEPMFVDMIVKAVKGQDGIQRMNILA